jgi:hypothetical protein
LLIVISEIVMYDYSKLVFRTDKPLFATLGLTFPPLLGSGVENDEFEVSYEKNTKRSYDDLLFGLFGFLWFRLGRNVLALFPSQLFSHHAGG